jgi:5-hydroxyisourate hydrolase-like protein (transthyretin family)
MGTSLRSASSHHRIGRAGALLVLLALVLGAAVIAAVSAPAASAGGITGTVSVAKRVPLPGALVTAYRDDGSGWVYLADVTTDANGAFSFSGLADGDYTVGYSFAGWANQWYDGQWSLARAESIAVWEWSTTKISDARMVPSAALMSGKVTASDGQPARGAKVSLRRTGPEPDTSGDVADLTTDDRGVWSAANVPSGTYAVYVDYFKQDAALWYKSSYLSESATRVTVPAGGTVDGLDMSLQAGGTVTGTVTGVDGAPLAGIIVELHLMRADGDAGWCGLEGTTDASGRFTFTGVPPTTCTIWFTDYSDVYLPQWYGGGEERPHETFVVTSGGTTAGIDAVMAKPSTISGRVVNAAGDPVGGVRVDVWEDSDVGWRYVTSSKTAQDGTYLNGRLRAGIVYRVRFEPSAGSGLLAEWWNDKRALSAADTFVLGPEERRESVDAALEAKGTISGTLTGPEGQPVAGYVEVFPGKRSSKRVGIGRTDASGAYTVPGLDPGSYVLRFRPYSNEFLAEWFDDRQTKDQATVVPVGPGDEIKGISAQLAYSGRVAGRVSDSGGRPIEAVRVAAYASNGRGGWTYIDDASTDAAGGYVIRGLTDGAVRVGFFDNHPRRFLPVYFDGQPSLPEARSIDVAIGQTTFGIDATMYRASTIEGHVETPGGGAAHYITVTAYRPDDDGGWQYVTETTTDEVGDYRLDRLSSGTYRIGFRNWQERYATSFFPSGDSVFDGESVVLKAEEHMTGVDVRLVAAGGIAGTVSGEGAGPLADVRIMAYAHTDEDGWRYVADATTDVRGAYRVTCLGAGAYRLRVTKETSGRYSFDWRSEWYANVANLTAATSIRVGRGQTAGPINVELSRGSTLEGTVTSEGAGADGVNVKAYRRSAQGSWSYAADVTSDSSGAYVFKHLWGGDYLVCFSPPPGSASVGEWYDDAYTWSSARTIVLPDSGEVHGVDASLGRGGSISGSVTDEALGKGLAAHVVALREDDGGWDYAADVTADSISGAYTLAGLTPGEYRLQFVSPDPTSVCGEWWDNQPIASLADSVSVASGDELKGYDAALARGGSIEGAVSRPGGDPLPDSLVTAYRSDGAGGWSYVMDATTSSSGEYKLTGVAAGDYRVRFTHQGDFAPQWYAHATKAADATAFAVTSAGNVSGIDGELGAGAVLSGRAVDTAGRPVPDLRVIAYADEGDGWAYVDEATTDGAGTYRIAGLGHRPYRVEFRGESWRPQWVTQWYSGAATQEEATSVDLSSGAGRADVTMLHTGDIVELTSPTHPDTTAWYRPAEAEFRWSVLNGGLLEGYGYSLDGSAATSAPRHDMGAASSATVAALGDGVWYFHVRAFVGQAWALWDGDWWACSWGPTRSYAVHVDGTAPTTQIVGAVDGWRSVDAHLALSAMDATSGMTGGSAKTEYRVDTGSWMTGTSVTIPAPAAGSNDGVHEVTYRSTDVAGNQETDKSTTVKIDATAPVTSVSGADDSWHRADVELSLGATDARSGMSGGAAKTEYKIDGGDWRTGTSVTVQATPDGSNDGAHTVTYRSTDAAGNQEAQKSVTVKIDTLAPQTAASGADAAWHRASVTVMLTPADAGSGMTGGSSKTEYRVDAGAWTTGTSVVVPAPADGSNDGVHTITYRSVDAAGIQEADKSTAVKIDVSAPVTAQSGADAGWHQGSVTVTLTPADAGSGMAGGSADTLYRVDAGTWTSGRTVVVTGSGSHTVSYCSIDNAGNTEAVTSVTVLVDGDAPSTTVGGADTAWHSRPVTLTFTATDTDGGVAYTEYSLDAGATWTKGISVVVVAPFGGDNDGEHAVLYRSADTLGNVEAGKSVTVRIDTVGPRTRALGRVAVKRRKTAVLGYRVNDAAPNGGTATVTVKILNRAGRVVAKVDAGTVQTGVSLSVRWKARLAKGDYHYAVYAKDAAGNAQTRVGSARLTVD